MSALEQPSDLRRHDAKIATPQPSIMLGEAVLKWYDIARPETPVPIAVRALARRCLRDAVKLGSLAVAEDELGFVVLHRCEEDFYFLLVSTWRNENELWESVWAKDAQTVLFRPWATEGTHRPTFCVWELGAVAHERVAWTTYLRSARDDAARRAYLRDCYDGLV